MSLNVVSEFHSITKNIPLTDFFVDLEMRLRTYYYPLKFPCAVKTQGSGSKVWDGVRKSGGIRWRFRRKDHSTCFCGNKRSYPSRGRRWLGEDGAGG